MQITYEQRAAWYDFEQTVLDDQTYLQEYVKAEGNSLLEVPCASGRNIPWLKQLNQRIVLADLSPAMIAICNAKLARLEVNATTVLADMRKLSLGTKVDTIIVPQDGILLLPSIQAISETIEAMWGNLNPNGRLLIDIPLLGRCKGDAPCKPLYFDADLDESISVSEWEKEIPGNCILSRRRRQLWIDESNTWKLMFDYSLKRANGEQLGSYSTEVFLLCLTLEQLLEAIRNSAFEIDAMHQDYSSNNLSETFCRVILHLRRK